MILGLKILVRPCYVELCRHSPAVLLFLLRVRFGFEDKSRGAMLASEGVTETATEQFFSNLITAFRDGDVSL